MKGPMSRNIKALSSRKEEGLAREAAASNLLAGGGVLDPLLVRLIPCREARKLSISGLPPVAALWNCTNWQSSMLK